MSTSDVIELIGKQRLPIATEARQQVSERIGISQWAEMLCELSDNKQGNQVAPKLAAMVLRCTEGPEGKEWLQADGGESPGGKLSNAEVLIPALAKSRHSVIRRSIAQAMGRLLQEKMPEGGALGAEWGGGVIFALSHGLLEPLSRAMVDCELVVAEAAFKAAAVVLVAGGRADRENGGLVTAAAQILQAVRELVAEAREDGRVKCQVAAWTACMRVISVDAAGGAQLAPLPFNFMLLALNRTLPSDEPSNSSGAVEDALKEPETLELAQGALEVLREAADNTAATSAAMQVGCMQVLQAMCGDLEHPLWGDALTTAACFVTNYGTNSPLCDTLRGILVDGLLSRGAWEGTSRSRQHVFAAVEVFCGTQDGAAMFMDWEGGAAACLLSSAAFTAGAEGKGALAALGVFWICSAAIKEEALRPVWEAIDNPGLKLLEQLQAGVVSPQPPERHQMLRCLAGMCSHKWIATEVIRTQGLFEELSKPEQLSGIEEQHKWLLLDAVGVLHHELQIRPTGDKDRDAAMNEAAMAFMRRARC